MMSSTSLTCTVAIVMVEGTVGWGARKRSLKKGEEKERQRRRKIDGDEGVRCAMYVCGF